MLVNTRFFAKSYGSSINTSDGIAVNPSGNSVVSSDAKTDIVRSALSGQNKNFRVGGPHNPQQRGKHMAITIYTSHQT
jgi:hypothetical protein